MTTKTLSTYVAAGYTLASQYDTLDITTTGGVGGYGVFLNHLATLDNDGRVHASPGHNGVYASAGATVVNGSAGDTTASIYGYSGVSIHNAAGTVINFGSITGSARYGDGVYIVAGGAVTNGSAADTSANIYADFSGVAAAALATVTNFGSINGYFATGVYLKAGGSVTNGTAQDTAAVIFSYMGQGVDVATGTATIANFGEIRGVFGNGAVLGGGGVITNGSTKDTTASIGGQAGVVASNTYGTVKNFGSIDSYGTAFTDAGVYLAAGGSVTNGAARDTTAVIQSVELGVYVKYGAATVVNYGTIQSSKNSAIYIAGGGYAATNLLTNGSAKDSGALIQGAGDGVAIGRYGTVNNFGTIEGDGTADFDAGVHIARTGAVTNGSAADSKATIEGYDGVLIGAGFVNNFGTINAIGATYGDGVILFSGGGVTNGSASDATALIEGTHRGVLIETYVLNATVTNWGTISGAGASAVALFNASDTLVVEARCAFVGQVLGGGGTLDLDTGTGTLTSLLAGGNVTVSGSMAPTTFSNFGTVEIGAAASFVTAGAVTLAAGQSVVASGSLTLGGAKAHVANAGIIETVGGTVTVKGAVTGAGQAIVKAGLLDFTSTFNQNVTFIGGVGTLELAKSQSYGGTIAGFSKSGGTFLDLADIKFIDTGEATYSGTKTGGVLTVTDGTHTATINLVGNYLNSTFIAASDGHGGTLVHDPAKAPAAVPSPHRLIAAMAGLGAGAAAGLVRAAVEPWRRDAQALAKPA